MDTITAPQTVEERLSELEKDKYKAKIFAVYPSGRESDLVGIGKTYEAAWKHAADLLDVNKDDLRKKGYVFDHVSVQNAERMLNGLPKQAETENVIEKSQVIPIGRGKMTSKHLQSIARRAKIEASNIEEEEAVE